MKTLTTFKAPEFGITLELFYAGSEKLPYKMYRNDSLLFEGDDFKPSPLHNIDDMETALDLLAFLCCTPGDVDEDYFKDYSPEQVNWSESYDCEAMQGLINDLEEKESEYHADALERIEFIVA